MYLSKEGTWEGLERGREKSKWYNYLIFSKFIKMVIHNSNKYIRPYPPKESWPYLVSVGKLAPPLAGELVHPALTTAWLSLADDFWCSLSAQQDSSSLGGLATGNLTRLQWIYAQRKMDLFCVWGGDRKRKVKHGKTGSEWNSVTWCVLPK